MTGYQSKKKAASAKTIEVNWADHEPDGRRVAQEPDTYRSVPHGHCTHPKCKEVFIAYIEANKRLAHYEPEGKSPMLFNTSPPQPAQEPVAWLTRDSVDGCWYATAKKVGKDDKPLYTTPPQRPWVGLTAEEAAECWTTSATQTWKNFEAKLKEKNNAA